MSSAEELDLLRASVRGVFAAGARSSGLSLLGDLGLVGLLVNEERGGAGWCPVEATVVADEAGRTISLGGAASPSESGTTVPWLSALIAAAALSTGANEELLASTLDGTSPSIAVAAHVRARGGTLSGSLVGVEGGERVPAVVVLGEAGQIHVVGLGGPGVSVRPEPTSIDTTRLLWRVELSDAPAAALGPAPEVHDVARVLAAATSLGSLRAALDRLLPYLSDRVAFGSPIASFQAIQHRIVELSLLETRAAAAVDAAARALAADPVGASRLAALAHGFVMERVPPALDECIQLTGGIGFTWEYPLHHELRRSVTDATTFGSARDSREELLALTGWA